MDREHTYESYKNTKICGSWEPLDTGSGLMEDHGTEAHGNDAHLINVQVPPPGHHWSVNSHSDHSIGGCLK